MGTLGWFSWKGDDICDRIFKNDNCIFFKAVIANMRVILSIINSDLPATISIILGKLPFFRFSPTLHTILFHSWEWMELNGSRGLKRYAEDYTSDTRGRNRKNGQNNNYITILKYWLQYLNITIYETTALFYR